MDMTEQPPEPTQSDQSVSHPWYAGLTCDHLYADCPSRIRGEEGLRRQGMWDLGGDIDGSSYGIDPHGPEVCGMCRHRYDREQRKGQA